MSKRRILGDVIFDGDVEALASKLRAKGFDCVMTYVYDYDLPEEFESSEVMSVWKDIDIGLLEAEEEAVTNFGNAVDAIVDGLVFKIAVVPLDFVPAPGKQWPDDIGPIYEPIFRRA